MKKAIVYIIEVILCAVALGLILFYFSNSFSSLEQENPNLDSDSLIYSLIQTRDINSSNLQNTQESAQLILGAGFESEMFYINNSCYQINPFTENPNCSISFNTNKNIFSGQAKLETGETLKLIFWRQV